MSQDEVEERFLEEIITFLGRRDIEEFFLVHPNQLTVPGFCPSPSWSSWWDWPTRGSSNASNNKPTSSAWDLLWQYYTVSPPTELAANKDDDISDLIPAELRSLIDDARRLQLCRTRGTQATVPSLLAHAQDPRPRYPNKSIIHGMSPKKAHEVVYMTEHVSKALSLLSQQGLDVRRVVDVGAGQAYLSRSLRDELGLHALALDWSSVQTEGAARREEAEKKRRRDIDAGEGVEKGSLTYQTLEITSESLLEATSAWVKAEHHGDPPSAQGPLPVLLVALHACGSLTLDIFRAISSRLRHQTTGDESQWKPAAAVLVGCCYNLLREPDQRPLTTNRICLTPNHLQLATQVPSQWAQSPQTMADARLAIRKVAWRALLQGILHERSSSHEIASKRLGRINDSAYKDWSAFLNVAGQRLGVDLTATPRDTVTENRVEMFQFLRCILGPVVESFLLLDRKLWLKRELEGTGMDVELFNIFDQASGSARNVATIITPSRQTTS